MFTMAHDVRFLIEYSLPQDIAEVLSENLIAFDPDSEDDRSPSRLVARAIESRLVDPTQPPILLQDYADEQWALETLAARSSSYPRHFRPAVRLGELPPLA